MMFNKVYIPLRSQTRQCSSLMLKTAKPVVELDKTTKNSLEKKEIKPRKHAGVVFRQTNILPEWVMEAIKLVVEDYPNRQILEDSRKFYRHFLGRHPPAEREETEAKLDDIKKDLRQEKRYENVMPEDEEKVENQVSTKALQVLRTNVQYSSSAVKYDSYNSILYMMARSAPDYAVMYKIFHEIKSRDKDFKAKNLLDFGSGIGTVSWAAMQLWENSLKEHVCIEASPEMTELAETLAKHAQPKIKGMFHRQFLPVTPLPRFDIVVSAFTLFDLPDRKSRLEVILALWRKTERYLVLVEQGTNAGFKIINEARDLIIHLIEKSSKEDGPQGYIFSPCPHELKCPKMAVNDGTPCNFPASHTALALNNSKFTRKERYSYVVFKKGDQREGDEKKWPRIVRPTLVRSRHAICRMCIPNGKLMEVFFSIGKHERPVYNCAKSSEWGDRLPIEIVSETPK